MKCALIEQTGSPESVVLVKELPSPLLEAGQVRLRMLHAPVNPADLNFIEGHYGKKPDLPAVPGMEGVGRVEEVAPGVESISPGALAIPLGGMGCWSEEIVRPAEKIFVLPGGIAPLQAAMLRVNPATAWGLLHAAGELPPGSWVVQNAASSAAGHCVIQVARHLGLKILCLVRRPESIAKCTELGADMVLVDSPEAVKEARETPGFSAPLLALNAVGGDSALRLMDLLAPGGTLVTYGAMGRQPVKVPNGFLIFKDIRLMGFWVTKWLESAPDMEVHELYSRLATLVLKGKLQQPIAAEYPLLDLPEALKHAAGSARNGKVIVTMSR